MLLTSPYICPCFLKWYLHDKATIVAFLNAVSQIFLLNNLTTANSFLLIYSLPVWINWVNYKTGNQKSIGIQIINGHFCNKNEIFSWEKRVAWIKATGTGIWKVV